VKVHTITLVVIAISIIIVIVTVLIGGIATKHVHTSAMATVYGGGGGGSSSGTTDGVANADAPTFPREQLPLLVLR
jgi:hypothetical protein